MTQQNWLTKSQDKPPVSWDGGSKSFSIVLGGLTSLRANDTIEAQWKPPLTYVVRIREANGGSWSCGFETPLTACGFVDLRPDTEYEIEIRAKNSQGEGKPAKVTVRTNPKGDIAV